MAEEVVVRVKPVDKTVEKYFERAKLGVKDYEYYIQRPRRGPASAAISMRKTLEEKMAKKETWDKWEERLSGIGDAGVIDAALQKGVKRFVPGVEYGKKYFEQFYKQFSAHLAEGLKKVLAMPRVTLDDSIARAVEMIKHNAQFKFIKKFG